MSDNPFDQLGLKKDILIYLHTQGKLEPFLKSFYHLAQTNIHPDYGGSHDLSALINSAYRNIKQSPSNIDHWLKTMQNGANPEYLELIEGLAGEVERLKKTEKDYETLKLQYAELLTGKKGEEEKIKNPPASRTKTGGARVASPKVSDFSDPAVRSPPKSAGRASSSSSDTGTKSASAEPIELHDIILYDAKGKPAKEYRKVILAGSAEKGRSDEYLTKTQDSWVSYWKTKGKQMPDFPLFYALVEKMEKENHPGKAGLLSDLKESWLSLSTRIDYRHNKLIHGYGFSPEELSCSIPIEDGFLDEFKSREKWRSVIQALLMPKDVDEAVEILHQFSGVRPYIWSPSKESRKENPLRAAFVNTGSDRLNLYCDNRLDGNNRSRWVEIEK